MQRPDSLPRMDTGVNEWKPSSVCFSMVFVEIHIHIYTLCATRVRHTALGCLGQTRVFVPPEYVHIPENLGGEAGLSVSFRYVFGLWSMPAALRLTTICFANDSCAPVAHTIKLVADWCGGAMVVLELNGMV